jgi:hypothetical protein
VYVTIFNHMRKERKVCRYQRGIQKPMQMYLKFSSVLPNQVGLVLSD